MYQDPSSYAYLKQIVSINPLTYEKYISGVEWVGSPLTVLKVPSDMASEVKKLPFEVEEIECPCKVGYFFVDRYFVRKDHKMWLAYHRFMADWESLMFFCRTIKTRLIFTCVVWGIGWVNDGQIPGWYCLRQKRLY